MREVPFIGGVIRSARIVGGGAGPTGQADIQSRLHGCV